MKRFSRYVRSFAIGIILAALVFGTLGVIKATQTEASPPCPQVKSCQEIPQPIPIPTPQIPDCSNPIPPCTLDAAK